MLTAYFNLLGSGPIYVRGDLIQAPQGKLNMSDLYWLTDEQMARLAPYFPKSHGRPRVDDRRGLSGIILVNRNGLRWWDAPKDYGPHKPVVSLSKGRSTIVGALGPDGRLHAHDGRALGQC